MDSRKFIFGIILIFLVYALSIVFFSPSPRGTDQFWNLGNIDRIIHMDGVWKTNNIFPSGMPEDLSELPRPWIQNRPVTYIGAVFGIFTGNSHAGWMIMNFLLLAGIVWIFLFVAKNNKAYSLNLLLCSAVLVFNPQIFYLGMQALPEVFNAFLATALLLVLMKVKPLIWKAILAAILSGLLYYQRESFVLLFLLLPVFFFVFYEKKENLILISSYLIVVVAMYFIRPVIFPDHSVEPISPMSQLVEVRQGNSNMVNYLFPNPPQRSAGEIVNIIWMKFLKALELQFIPKKADAVFYYSINLLLIPLFLLLRKYRSLDEFKKQAVFFITGLVVIQLATIIIFENQNRFSSVLVPLLILCLYWVTTSLNKWQFLMNSILAFCIALSVVIGVYNFNETKKYKEITTELKQINQLTNHSTIMAAYFGGKSILLSYAVMPEYIYYFPVSQDWEEVKEISEKLNTAWFIYPENIELGKKLEPFILESHLIANQFRLSRLRLAE